jgi:hydroxymethylpyrimidine/phosphomethylpyrimidine kinase
LANHTGNGSGTPPILLTIAGFDPSCGAGIGADLKTFAAHNCYGVAAVTALTVQSTQGVRSVHAIPAATLRAQLEALAEDTVLAGVKIGMLANRANASAVAEFLDQHKFAHVVLDPVSRPTAGNLELLDAPGLKFVRDELLKRASVITPNHHEAARAVVFDVCSRTLHEQFASAPAFVLKDPRLCLTLPAWLPALRATGPAAGSVPTMG